jgi:RNA polymerase sigma-70 factor, ECF subfamily
MRRPRWPIRWEWRQLRPVERAVFLLREAFELEYSEIAQIVEKSEANCRQLFSRARAQLARSEASESKPPTERATQIVQRFLHACTTGDMQGLLSVLTDDAVLYGDGGDRVKAVPAPLHTASEISRFFMSIREQAFAGAEVSLVPVNGGIGILNRGRDGDVTVTSFAFAGDRIRAIYAVRNPEKLRHVKLPG